MSLRDRSRMQFAFSQAPIRFLRRVTLRWLQGIFRGFPVGEGQFAFRGNSDPASELRISGKAPWAPEEQEHRPAIVLTRGGNNWNNSGMGAGVLVQDTQMSQDRMRKTALVSGVYNVNCLAKVGDEAEQLAWIVSFWFAESWELLARCGFHGLGPPMVGQVSPAPDALVQTKRPEWMVCPVTIPHSFQYSWETVPERTAQLEELRIELEDEIEQLVATVVVDKE